MEQRKKFVIFLLDQVIDLPLVILRNANITRDEYNWSSDWCSAQKRFLVNRDIGGGGGGGEGGRGEEAVL